MVALQGFDHSLGQHRSEVAVGELGGSGIGLGLGDDALVGQGVANDGREPSLDFGIAVLAGEEAVDFLDDLREPGAWILKGHAAAGTQRFQDSRLALRKVQRVLALVEELVGCQPRGTRRAWDTADPRAPLLTQPKPLPGQLVYPSRYRDRP